MSRTFGVDHAESILAWHCLNIFPEDIYYMEALDTAVIFRMKQHQIRLYDVIGKSTPELQQVVGSIVPEGLYEVAFHFTPDFRDIRTETVPYEPEDYIFFVKSKGVRLTGEFFYPYTAIFSHDGASCH